MPEGVLYYTKLFHSCTGNNGEVEKDKRGNDAEVMR